MKNFSIFDLYTDGASRGNPGESGIGIIIYKNGELFAKEGYYISKTTNNHAEYLAILVGLILINKNENIEKVNIFCDSLLAVKQINGEYKIKNSVLINCNNYLRKLIGKNVFSINHIFREKNKVADEMANRGIDDKKILPEEILFLLFNNNCINR